MVIYIHKEQQKQHQDRRQNELIKASFTAKDKRCENGIRYILKDFNTVAEALSYGKKRGYVFGAYIENGKLINR